MARFETNRPQIDDGVERKALDPSLETYRYGVSWNPYAILGDLNAVIVEMSHDHEHIWDGSDRHQMYASATWMAASRQVIANAMLTNAETHASNNRIAVDLQEMALLNYTEAITWLQLREAVNADADYALSALAVDTKIQWPHTDKQPVSRDLVRGIIAAAREIIYVQHPNIESFIGGPYEKPFYSPHRDHIEQRFEELRDRFDRLSEYWDESLNLQIEPGCSLYASLVELLEEVVQLGVNEITPRTVDPSMRLVRRKKTPKGQLGEFEPWRAFHKPASEAQEQPTSQPMKPEVTLLPSFDTSLLQQSVTAPGPTITPAQALPEFKPVRFHSESAPASAGLPRFAPERSSEPLLSKFQPLTASRPQESKPSRDKDEEDVLPPLKPLFSPDSAESEDNDGLPPFKPLL